MSVVRFVLLVITFISLYFAVFWFSVFFMRNESVSAKKRRDLPFVSIVVPAWNEESRILQTLTSLSKLTYSKFEVIVVDDGSTDRTVTIVKNFIKSYPYMRLFSKPNGGKGSALNVGLCLCKGEFFVCMDADSSIEPNALEKMLPHFTDDNVAVVLPSLKVRDPKTLLERMQWYEYLVNMFYKWLMAKLNTVHVAPGPFSVYRKCVLDKVGGFDENNLTEDMEIVLRLQKNHYCVKQLLDPVVTAGSPNTLRSLYRQRNRWYKGSVINAWKYRWMFFNRNYGDFSVIQFPMIVISGLMAIVLLSLSVYDIGKPLWNLVRRLWHVNFDVFAFIKNLEFSLSLLDFDYMGVVLAFAMLFISGGILFYAHRHTRESLFKFGAFPLILYAFGYFFLLGTVWIGIAVELLLGKRQRW